MSPLNLAFDDGAPIDAGKLQQLVTFINEVNTNALMMPDITDISKKVVASTMSVGQSDLKSIEFSGQATAIDITFSPPLVSLPLCVIVTLESTSKDLDLVHYVDKITTAGCTVWVNRVAGTNEVGVIQSGAATRSVRVHYLAIARP